MYVLDDTGQRVICPHPGEYFVAGLVLGFSRDEAAAAHLHVDLVKKWWWSPRKRREFEERVKLLISHTGFLTDMVCCDCQSEFSIDLTRDVRECPTCHSTNVFSVTKMPGKQCPACKLGEIIEIDTGMVS